MKLETVTGLTGTIIAYRETDRIGGVSGGYAAVEQLGGRYSTNYLNFQPEGVYAAWGNYDIATATDAIADMEYRVAQFAEARA